MKSRILILFIIIAFFAPVFKPLAHSSGPKLELCTTSVPQCRHGKTCSMHKAAQKHGCHTSGVKAADHKQCGVSFKCGTKDDTDKNLTQIQEMPFLIGTVFFGRHRLISLFTLNNPDDYKDYVSLRPERPPSTIL
ncbi:MAG: hypothetical protein HYS21_08465 [Deltaproteobacteria bacterium]|nr:hypothetical protein [Deltaproteobacteria bacterium]